MTFRSTSRSESTLSLYSSSFVVSTVVGITPISRSSSSAPNLESSLKSRCRSRSQSSSGDTLSLLSTMAIFWARVASSTVTPAGFCDNVMVLGRVGLLLSFSIIAARSFGSRSTAPPLTEPSSPKTVLVSGSSKLGCTQWRRRPKGISEGALAVAGAPDFAFESIALAAALPPGGGGPIFDFGGGGALALPGGPGGLPLAGGGLGGGAFFAGAALGRLAAPSGRWTTRQSSGTALPQ
mmetsp:Transcript_64547/g.140528  ORF Transcript_64547/g.140528 Transcript_64547/m.140528 type:complete len:237 (-) Transcript_64547:305-1015(-)